MERKSVNAKKAMIYNRNPGLCNPDTDLTVEAY